MSRSTVLKALLAIALVVVLVSVGGCGGSGQGGGSDVGEGFVIGPARTVEVAVVANQAVPDANSGLTFVYPTAGTHRLTVAAVTQSPARPFTGGRGAQISRDGGFPLTLRFPQPGAGTQAVVHWAATSGCWDGGPRPDNEWLGIPPRTPGDGFVYFDLPNAASGSAPAQAGSIVSSIWWGVVPAPANAAANKREMDRVIFTVGQALPAGPLKTRILGLLGPQVYYVPNWSICAYTNDPDYGPTMYLRTNADLETVAHETCHYLTHQLMTDAAWQTVQDAAPRVSHDWGQVFSRTSGIADDYAYFLQYLAGNYRREHDVTNVVWLTRPNDPRVMDTPSREGFVAQFMYALTSANDTDQQIAITSFARTQDLIPNISATPGEVALLLNQGAPTFWEFRAAVSQFARDRGYQADALEVIVERLGWSYSCKCTLYAPMVYPEHEVVTVQVRKDLVGFTVPEGSFYLPEIRVPINQEVTLPRVYRGGSWLVVRRDGWPSGYNELYPIYVNPELPTTDTPDLGNIEMTTDWY